MRVRWAAPGRINLIGEHVDYNDGVVLPCALPFTTKVTLTSRDDELVEVRSAGIDEPARFAVHTEPGDVEGWASYVAGAMWALESRAAEEPQRAKRWEETMGRGLRIDVESDVPVGAGLSSSAALECAVLAAMNDLATCGFGPSDLAVMGQRAENDYVGMPCGVMDQMTSMHGKADHLVWLDTRSLEIQHIPFKLSDHGLILLVVDTRAKHELVDGEYADRRRSCEAAAEALQVASLRDATPEQVSSLSDPVLRRRAHHVVSEIQRVVDVADILRAGRPADIGAFLTSSHESLRDDFEVSCAELDVTVDEAVAAGALGARMTGGGFGGSALALVREGDAEAVEKRVMAAFERSGFETPHVFAVEAAEGARRLG
ncbi:MAG: galactokinase [Nocardioidaceae bacterium]|nr:galactokinase [Nocardioidaceae bacterium]